MPSPPEVPLDPALVDDARVGVYVHVPFCERVCPYCDFPVVAARRLRPEVEARYVEAILRELAARRSSFPERPVACLYLGGGTPALLRPESILRIVTAIEGAFATPLVDSGVEITLELNPSTVEVDRLAGFREAGVNRLSIGIQSFQDELLKRLGRAHRSGIARETLAGARCAGFENVSLDLIFAVPGQTIELLDRDLDEAIGWQPQHVSTYELTFEPDTPFGRALASGRIAGCDEDLAAQMIEHVEHRLVRAGYDRYEISNYARAGFRSRHNTRYWQRQAVLGLGMGAHSFEPRTRLHPHGRRVANPSSLESWLDAVEAEPPRPGAVELLSTTTARGEAVFLALRQREGLSAERFEAEFGAVPRRFFDSEISTALERGWLEEGTPRPGDLRLTRTGRLLADTVAALFVEAAGD